MRSERNTNKNVYRQLPFNLKVAAGTGYYHKILFITKHGKMCDMFIQFINGTEIIMMALFQFYRMAVFVFSDCSGYLHESGKHGEGTVDGQEDH